MLGLGDRLARRSCRSRSPRVWWERRHDVSRGRATSSAVVGGWLELGGTFVAICVALLVVMALARLARQLVVDPGRGRVRRDRGGARASSARTSFPGSRRRDDAELVRDVRALRARAGRRRHPASHRGGERRHEPGERLRVRHGADRDDRPLGHAARRPVHRRRGARRPRARARRTTRATTCPRRSPGSGSSRSPAGCS